MPWKRSFEAFVEATGEAKSVDRLCELLLDSMLAYGWDQLNFSIQKDEELSVDHTGFGIISTYPKPWQTYYHDREFWQIDPVARCAAANLPPFRWSDLIREMPLSRQQVNFLQRADEAGLHNGIGIPFSGPRNQIAGIAMATSDRRLARSTNLDLLAAYCQHFYRAYKRVTGVIISDRPSNARLSPQEREIMIRVAHGRSNHQIASSLGIGADTVDDHLRRVFRKLGVHSRIEAALLCVKYGLIEV